jgi:type IV pilus assembly protein PilW
MKIKRHREIRSPRRQRGLTVLELLVAGVISLIASAGMVIVMANTLGTGTQTIQMSRLTQEMRTAMQIMSRELRRANYHSGFMACYGNTGCLQSPTTENPNGLGIDGKIGPIQIEDSNVGTDDCLIFYYQRPQMTLAASPVAAFRRTTVANSSGNVVGKIQMTVSGTSDPDCTMSGGWIDITDPDIADIMTFNVTDAESVTEVINTNNDTQQVERIGLTMTGQLAPDASLPLWLQTGTNPNAARQLQEFITVRNHTTTMVVAGPSP